jgi:type VI secretion system protein ImpK
MTDRVPPRSPFGIPDDRTVIRPNPGGRRAIPQQPSGVPPPAYAPVPQGQTPPQPVGPAGTPYVPPTAPGNPNPDEWISSQAPPPQPVAPQARLPEVRIDELVAPNENPILRSAGPLLLLLGRLRVALARASFASLMEQVAEAIRFFERDIRSAGIPEAQANAAKYIICATADDIVQNIPTDDRHVWTQYSMLSRFFGERTGGLRFFDELTRLKQDPVVNYDLLELQHTCLALGFHGKYRTTAGNVAELQQIQRDLYETLRRVRPKVYGDLSPHWRGQNLASHAARWRAPWWAVLGVAGLLMFGLYFLLLYWLSGDVDPASARMVALLDAGKLQIVRREPPPPVKEEPKPVTPAPPTQLQTICAALGPEVAADQAMAEQNANQITVRVGNVLLFDSGSATVRSAFKPIAERIAKTLNDQKGFIKIVGHTDNEPITHTPRFPSNYHLSLERAKKVAELFRPLLSDPDRLQIDGKGETAPVADNKTPEGKAKNRRVEFLIPRTDPGLVAQRTCQR